MHFYVLKDDTQSRQCATLVSCVDDDVVGDAPKCPACGATYGMLRWMPPYKIAITRHGKQFGDIVFAPGDDIIVTEAFRQAWIQSRLKGLDSFDPVEIVRTKPKKAAASVPAYWHVVINRGLTAVDMVRSTFAYFINEPPTCIYCGGSSDSVAGFEIDQSTWTGEDIFVPRNMAGTVVVTQPFVDMVSKYHLTHSVLIPTEKYIFDPLHLIVPYTESKA